MSKEISELDETNFHQKTSKGNWVIDFWADWCMPCKVLAPEFEEASKEFKGKINFAKVDVEKNQELAQEYSIMSIPCVVFVKDGEIVNKLVGAMPKDEIVSSVRESF